MDYTFFVHKKVMIQLWFHLDRDLYKSCLKPPKSI